MAEKQELKKKKRVLTRKLENSLKTDDNWKYFKKVECHR